MFSLAFLAVPAAATVARPRARSLSEALAEVGVPTMSRYMVRDHKRFEAFNEWGGFESIFTALDRLLWVPRLYFVPRAIEWLTGRQYGALHFVLICAMACISGVGCLLGHSGSWLLAIPLLATIPSAAVYFISYYVLGNQSRLMGSWRHCRLGSKTHVFGMHGDLELVPTPPATLKDRIKQAQSVPGTRILIEYRGSDPFVVAVRGLQRAHIGAWFTGNRVLDTF